MNKFQKAYWLLRKFGPRIVRLRGGVYLRNALGQTRRAFPLRSWNSIQLEEICTPGTPTEADAYAQFKRSQAVVFAFPLGKPPVVPESLRGAQQRQPPLAERLKLIEQNRAIYCFRTPAPSPIDWNSNPLDGTRFAHPERTWCDIPDVAAGQGDLRLFWDPARAAWAIDLARSKSHGMQIDAGTIYWRWVDSFMNACPPWRGPNWKCGQESTVRLIAMAVGIWSLADDPATTPERWTQFARLAWATGYRIEHHFDYARSQKNNHALSEACGLMLVGHLFSEFLESAEWFKRGREAFCDELSRQMYADGSYVQHSMNYHRVMLQTATLAALLAQWHGQPFDAPTLELIGGAEEFLFQMLDETTAQAPLYGNNDGAWVLPLDECDFSDYRGAIQAAHYLVHGKRRLPSGPWDEDLVWLFGSGALAAPLAKTQAQSTAFNDGGYFTLRGAESWGMIRCHTFRDRPGQYDQLHFDLWHRGHNLLCDSGTYEYNPAEGKPLEEYFQLSRGHNTIEIDGRPPVERVSRFLYFPWPRADARHFETDGLGYQYFEGQRYDYDVRPWNVLHRRALVGLPDNVWLVIDDLLGAGRHTATLRWHLADLPVQLDAAKNHAAIQTPSGECYLGFPVDANRPWNRLEIIRGSLEPSGPQSYRAPYYGELLPIPTIEAEVVAELPLRLVTLLAPGMPCTWQLENTSSKGETYRLNWKDAAWRVELRPRSRTAKRIVLNIAACNPNSSSAKQTTTVATPS